FYKGKDKDFSFSDVYAPVSFGGARFCEIRVWTMFNKVAPGMDEYWDYVKGDIEHPKPHKEDEPITPENYANNRMPLWVKAEKKVSVQDMMAFMRDHLEGTELDMSNDVGAGPFGMPYRWRPLTWKVDGVAYCNERATATQQTGFSFIAQSRSWLPDAIGGIIWWGVDDASGTVYMPMYASITTIPHNFAVGNGGMMEWSETSGFWIFNQVQNFAYTRYSLIHPDVEDVQQKLEQEFVDFTPAIDKAAQSLFELNKDQAIVFLTNYSNSIAEKTFNTWKNLYVQLFMKFMDGNVKTKKEIPEGYKYTNPDLEQPGYSEQKYELIIKETGDKFKVKGSAH
ncbi:MAG: C69 family dipeptidase, partial [Bacteroidales bacterium]|nr:C69 family dipeptidase [Bacteroidales bacterium]